MLLRWWVILLLLPVLVFFTLFVNKCTDYAPAGPVGREIEDKDVVGGYR